MEYRRFDYFVVRGADNGLGERIERITGLLLESRRRVALKGSNGMPAVEKGSSLSLIALQPIILASSLYS
ncbi:MAG TPA: hypothetical protein VKF38_09890 [Anaerolineaceae bacterium]|nr:hypothetical protein [Anaerolineaceae bacterium]